MIEQPRVAIMCRFPLASRALGAALEGIADVHVVPSGRADSAGLLASVSPDAVVVDDATQARELEPFAALSPVVHVSVEENEVRVFRDGEWTIADAAPSPDAVRNVVAAAVFARTGRA